MDLVLDVKVYQGQDAAVEGARRIFPVLDCDRIRRAQRNAAKGPWDGGEQVGDHKDIMPVVIVGRGDIGPSSAGQRAEDAPEGNEARQLGPGPPRQQVPEADEGEAWAGCDGDEELEEGSLGVSVAYCGGDGGEPFLWVAEPLVLDDLVVVERRAHEEGAEEGGCRQSRGEEVSRGPDCRGA